ncbi:unnamed protein product [Prunus armeniaca]|uniref:Uncharacterized protein n=1 Tax=Prunus armeniaca TaxID=36596 RepID=A0A6J5UKF3_PRUAR|nr:unnamed protein product [Prunus armeniaca]CAB4306856.1 unnamed protein product [Prunus armeniaca]
MTKLTILTNYDGKWVNSLYKGGKMKALVAEKVTYEDVQDRLHDIVRVDPNDPARDWKIPLCITVEHRVLVAGSGSVEHPVPVDFTSETQANSDCGDGLILDDLENDKPHDNIEVYVERNNLRHDDVPHDNL